MKENIIGDISGTYALKIITTYKKLKENKKESVMSKQLLRSGTSIGANIMESEFAQSKADFISKLSISLKEANETRYWLMLLVRSGYLSDTEHRPLLNDCELIIGLLVRSIKTAKSNITK
ncbi:MAG: four helix bundle protein [Bacteroidota bacterium]